ncbi:Ppx/GppA phosphatase family protein [Actinocatenispora rupis]|uniref:Hydrolase n=1 Tax=Actinocatenispora rupis TaxID=519421 RepID=A0A8J3J558_9ACTN|nr:Ppx/GppA phosphatase family protein [Actinocatenispora rupis]GID10374.1 hydrolase [Actinocatenispora rupis]
MSGNDGDRVAAIDCGTNSIRLLVADRSGSDRNGAERSGGDRGGDGLTDVVRRMEIVRLGEGVDRTGMLAPQAIERTRVALVDYAEQIRALGATKVRMVATSASRDAGNAADFRAMVLDVLGVPPEVISGDEEAQLSFAGAVAGLPADLAAPYLVVDIGGGSTEFVVGTDRAESAVSVNIGCVRMTERHLRADPPTAEQVAAAEADIGAVVEGALATVAADRARTLVGLAGSVTTVAGIALDLPEYRPERIHHARIGRDRIAEISARLLGETHDERMAIPVMHPGRADVIGAGALILRIIADRTGLSPVVASEHDILDGIALSI